MRGRWSFLIQQCIEGDTSPQRRPNQATQHQTAKFNLSVILNDDSDTSAVSRRYERDDIKYSDAADCRLDRNVNQGLQGSRL